MFCAGAMRNKLKRIRSRRDAPSPVHPRSETGTGLEASEAGNTRASDAAGGSEAEQPRRAQEAPRIAPIFLRRADWKGDRDLGQGQVRPGWGGRQLTGGWGSSRDRQLSPAAVRSCLQEIQTSNTAFPVQIQFDSLQRRARDAESSDQDPGGQRSPIERKRKQAGENSQVSKRSRCSASAGGSRTGWEEDTQLRRNKLGLKRQSGRGEAMADGHQSVTECDVQPRESSLEDVLWTDKYSPQRSSEVIGNSVSVSKLHSWLKKWKLQAECEERTKTEERNHKDSRSDVWDSGDFQGEATSGGSREEPPGNAMLLTGPSGAGKTASVYACAQELGFKVFEVNCSSQRSGRLILSQLKEATQSHLVETSGKDPLKPAYFSNYSDRSCPAKREPAAGKSLPAKNVVSISKGKRFGRSGRDKKANPAAVTLANFFAMKAKADHLHSAGPSPPDKPDSKKSGGPAAARDHTVEHNKRTATSLILFEEVDVIFEDDVGFLAAIKTFMATTKRPVILTTNDPGFRERFGCSLEEIVFKSPSATNVCSYLQLVCLAEDAKLPLGDACSLVALSRGDVRRCLLQLQLWVKSAPKPKHALWDDSSDSRFPPLDSGCSAGMLGLHPVTPNHLLHLLKSWTEADMNKLLKLLTESWRRNHPLLYSNLELLLPTSRKKYDASLREGPPRTILSAPFSGCKKKVSKASSDCVEALAGFFDLLSFLDATMPAGERLFPDGGEQFVWTGAEMKDGLMDEPSEEAEHSRNLGREKLSEIRAAAEGLGFHSCWERVSEAWEKQGEVGDRRVDEKFTSLSRRGSLSFSSRPLCPPHVSQRRSRLSRTVLAGPFFSLLGNRQAVAVDYMPALRCMSRAQREERSVNYLSSKHLGLSKSTLLLLAEGFPHSSSPDSGC